MGDAKTDSDRAAHAGSAAVAGGVRLGRRWDERDWQTASLVIEAGASDARLTRLLRKPKALNAVHRVTRLHARGKQVTDAGLIAICTGLPRLEELDLRDASVTDQGVQALAALATLRKLDLRGSSVTEEGAARLRKALPKCEITK